MLSDIIVLLGAAGSIATAIGVFVAVKQLRLSKDLATTQFEDQMSAQYRATIQQIPVKALLGEKLTAQEIESCLHAFYHYFDLSNEQAFLHETKRISTRTWLEWEEGIRQNLERPAFKEAWRRIGSQVPESFGELRRLVPPGVRDERHRLREA